MNPLQYTSEEMFSSTELIRKSKMIFDKLNYKEIEKAIILRDGKPAFMLLDFEEYEKLMNDYLALTEFLENQDIKPKAKKETPVKKTLQEKEVVQKKSIVEPEVKEDEVVPKKVEEKNKELNEKDLEEAFAQIDNLDLNSLGKAEAKKETIKDFWE